MMGSESDKKNINEKGVHKDYICDCPLANICYEYNLMKHIPTMNEERLHFNLK